MCCLSWEDVYDGVFCVSFMIVHDLTSLDLTPSPLSPHDALKHHFTSLKTELGFCNKNFHETGLQYITIIFTFSPTSNHLYPLQVENCDSNSRLVVNKDDNGKFRLEMVKPSRCITVSFYIPENRLNFPTTKGFRTKISMKLVHQYMVIFFNFSSTSSHLHPLQVGNCDSNSRLVVDEDVNGKVRLERVKALEYFSINHGDQRVFYHLKSP